MLTVQVIPGESRQFVKFEDHPALKLALRDYFEARKMVKAGLIGNAGQQREWLRAVHRSLMAHSVKS